MFIRRKRKSNHIKGQKFFSSIPLFALYCASYENFWPFLCIIGKIKERGGDTIAQDEESSVVYGMNRVAVQNGFIDEEVTLIDISKKIVEYL